MMIFKNDMTIKTIPKTPESINSLFNDESLLLPLVESVTAVSEHVFPLWLFLSYKDLQSDPVRYA